MYIIIKPLRMVAVLGVIRNFIEILGIAAEEDLPEKPIGQLIKYDDAETIFIPEDKPAIKDIYQIAVGIDIKSQRSINTKDCKTIAIDGIKKLKIVYSQDKSTDKLVMLNLQVPYNTFIELPKGASDADNIYPYVLDAYFDLVGKRRIYAHFLYLLDVGYTMVGADKYSKKNAKSLGLLSIKEADEKDVPQIAISHEDFVIFDSTDDKAFNMTWEYHQKDSKTDMDCLYL